MSDKEEKLMTVKEVAEYLRLDEHTVYRMARKGEIPAYKVAGFQLSERASNFSNNSLSGRKFPLEISFIISKVFLSKFTGMPV